MNQNTKIAVLGLGAMGSRMAFRWLKAGYEVIVWNRNPDKTEALNAEKAEVAATPRDAAHRADAVVAMVRDNDASQQVWLTERTGAIHGLNSGAIAIESSTLSPDWIVELSGRISETGASFIEAPVLGTRPQAEAGQLIIKARMIVKTQFFDFLWHNSLFLGFPFELFANAPAAGYYFAHGPVFDAAHVKQKRFEFGQVYFALSQHGFVSIGFHEFSDEKVVGGGVITVGVG